MAKRKTLSVAVTPKAFKSGGQLIQSETVDRVTADITPGVRIRVHGQKKTGSRPVGCLADTYSTSAVGSRQAREAWLKTLSLCDRRALGDLLQVQLKAVQAACRFEVAGRTQGDLNRNTFGAADLLESRVVCDWLMEHGAPASWLFSMYFRPESFEPTYTDFDRTFALGDTVIYDSYNIAYTGAICTIAPATVSVNDDGKVHRLTLERFTQKNWDLDLQKTWERDSHYLQTC